MMTEQQSEANKLSFKDIDFSKFDNIDTSHGNDVLSDTLYEPQIGDKVRAYDFSFISNKDNKNYDKPFQYTDSSYYEGILVETNVYSPRRCCKKHYRIIAYKRIFSGKNKPIREPDGIIEVFPPMNGNRDIGGLNNGVQPIK